MDPEEHKRFMDTEIKRIEFDRWVEGVRIHKDPGQKFDIDWIDRNSEWFRSAWERSRCRTCSKFSECGTNLVDCCKNYKQKE